MESPYSLFPGKSKPLNFALRNRFTLVTEGFLYIVEYKETLLSR